MDFNDEWLMGYIEAKGCFTIPLQKLPNVGKKYEQDNIGNLKKKEIIREIKKIIKSDFVFREMSYKQSHDELKNQLTKILTLYSLKPDLYSSFTPRPTFSLTFYYGDIHLINQIMDFFNSYGIETYQPYKIGTNLRLEIKGAENCLCLYELLKNMKWHTYKKVRFDHWGHCILQISHGEHLVPNKRTELFKECQIINSKKIDRDIEVILLFSEIFNFFNGKRKEPYHFLKGRHTNLNLRYVSLEHESDKI